MKNPKRFSLLLDQETSDKLDYIRAHSCMCKSYIVREAICVLYDIYKQRECRYGKETNKK